MIPKDLNEKDKKEADDILDDSPLRNERDKYMDINSEDVRVLETLLIVLTSRLYVFCFKVHPFTANQWVKILRA